MRDETLKRLDELFAWAFGVAPHGEVVAAHIAEWQALRAELAAERCDACDWWLANRSEFEKTSKRCVYFDTFTQPDFCCSHFTKKELTK